MRAAEERGGIVSVFVLDCSYQERSRNKDCGSWFGGQEVREQRCQGERKERERYGSAATGGRCEIYPYRQMGVGDKIHTPVLMTVRRALLRGY